MRTLLRGEIDWGHLLKLARDHAMVPLLYWHLSLLPQVVPPAVLNELRDQSRANNLRNLRLTQELLRIVRVFEENGVAIVPYKGPVLAASVYGNLALRQFIDLDILVHKGDLTTARKLLISLGYRQKTRLDQAQESAFLRSQREYEFVRDDGTLVELHWAVTPRTYFFPLDPESLWGRLMHVPLGGGTVPTFSPEDLMLILCVHGSKHLWHRLAWICDVGELVRAHRTLDWERLANRARSLGGERMLHLGLFLANDLLGTELPKEVLQKVRRDPNVKPLASQVRQWLFEGGNESLGIFAEDESKFHPFRIKIRERTRDKLWYCAHTVLVPTKEDWALVPLPKPLAPLYYVIRPIRLAGKYGQRLVKRALK